MYKYSDKFKEHDGMMIRLMYRDEPDNPETAVTKTTNLEEVIEETKIIFDKD